MSDIEKLIQETIKAIKSRSYSGRKPEQGKMFNCACGIRHRGERCTLKYVVENEGLGKSMFKGRRLIPRGQGVKIAK